MRTTRYLNVKVLTFGMHWKQTSRVQIWDNDVMKKYMRFSYWFGGIDLEQMNTENRLKIKYSTNSDKYTWTSAYMDLLRAIAE